MHIRLAEVIAATDAARADLLALVTPLTDSQWDQRDGDARWSVGEIVAHLQLVEDGSLRALFRGFRNARDAGLAKETSTESLLTSLDRFRIREGARSIEAPPMVQPKPIPRADLMEKLRSTHEGLHKWAAEADGYALTEVGWPHPAVGDMNLYQWVLFLGQHEERHIRQIRSILAA